jgi:hypothetical protein
MAQFFDSSSAASVSGHAADRQAVIEVESRWLSPDSDYALGCECANPVLQIERWGQESASSKTGFFA